MISRASWIRSFPRDRAEEILFAYHAAIVDGRSVIAEHARRTGKRWVEMGREAGR